MKYTFSLFQCKICVVTQRILLIDVVAYKHQSIYQRPVGHISFIVCCI